MREEIIKEQIRNMSASFHGASLQESNRATTTFHGKTPEARQSWQQWLVKMFVRSAVEPVATE
ncbi:hypothetical protein AXW85_32435 [Pseudomonas aeruginosa]|nr:hypothetical protein AXW85_32435 [Pseudomonas aeruginosa]